MQMPKSIWLPAVSNTFRSQFVLVLAVSPTPPGPVRTPPTLIVGSTAFIAFAN